MSKILFMSPVLILSPHPYPQPRIEIDLAPQDVCKSIIWKFEPTFNVQMLRRCVCLVFQNSGRRAPLTRAKCNIHPYLSAEPLLSACLPLSTQSAGFKNSTPQMEEYSPYPDWEVESIPRSSHIDCLDSLPFDTWPPAPMVIRRQFLPLVSF